MEMFKPSTLAAALAAITFGLSASADDKQDKFRTTLSGYNEVHFTGTALRGAVSSRASGSFHAELHERARVIDYELSYENLEGTVSQSHIHFGQRHTVGGITVWLCQTAGTPAPAAVAAVTPVCPAPGGTVRGEIRPEQVLTVPDTGLAAGEFDELVRAMRAGATYVNVHSLPSFGPGEIRGQLRSRRHGHD